MSHKIPKLNSHVHSTGVPNYNLSHSSLSSCTKIPSHALLNLQLLSFCSPFPFFSVHFSHNGADLPNCERVKNWHNRLHTWHQRDSGRWNTTGFLSNDLFFNTILLLLRTFWTWCPSQKCLWNFMFSQEIDNLLRKYCKWWTPPPLLMGTFLGYLGQLDCHKMTAIYSLFLFLPLLYNCQPLCGFGARPWEILRKFKEKELPLESQPEGLNVFAQRKKGFKWQMANVPAIHRVVDTSRLRVLLFDNLVLEVLVQHKCVVAVWMRADESTKWGKGKKTLMRSVTLE